ncbi:MAG: hypothetical protein ACRDBG_28070 [Waterburya sp.]
MFYQTDYISYSQAFLIAQKVADTAKLTISTSDAGSHMLTLETEGCILAINAALGAYGVSLFSPKMREIVKMRKVIYFIESQLNLPTTNCLMLTEKTLKSLYAQTKHRATGVDFHGISLLEAAFTYASDY